ncbi:MAG: hypothetical protein AB7I13_00075 [Vicinamibacterales bacterium]
MAADQKGITVTAVEVTNFHRLTFARVEMIPGAGLVKVTGKNRSGKTSLLRSIRAALGGAGQVLPETVHAGAEDGRVRIELSNGFSVARRFTAAQPKGYLTVLGADGGEHQQGKLNEWLGPLSFDPLAFFELKPERQREILLALGSDPDLPKKLEQLRAARATKYEERTPWISRKRIAGQVLQPEGERPTPVDISAELARMGELQVAQRDLQDARRMEQRAREFQRKCQDDLGAARAEVQRLRAAIEAAERTVVDREDGLEAAVESARVAAEVVVGMSDPDAEIERVKARIGEADQVAATLEPWKASDRARAEAEEATKRVEAITAEMNGLDAQEKELLAGAGLPVDGLSFTADGSPLLNGRPLEVASGAERIRLAVAVALAAHPALRICLVDEANDIDLDGLAELDRLAQEHGFQVWAARLGIEGPGEIVVEDGKARARDAAPEAVPA